MLNNFNINSLYFLELWVKKNKTMKKDVSELTYLSWRCILCVQEVFTTSETWENKQKQK